MAAEINAAKLVKKFGRTVALDSVDFRSSSGINIILGPNGAGKSTLIKCIDGLYRPDRGSVRVLGVDPYADSGLKGRMSLLTENYALYDFLTVMDNMRFFGRLYGLGDEEIASRTRELLKELDAIEYRESKVETLSRGTKQKVAFCRALLNDPQVLLLDEPTAFLDAHAANAVRGIMLRYADEGRTILFVTQKIDEVTRYDARIMVMSKGRLAKETSTKNLYKTILGGSVINVRVAEPFETRKAERLPFLLSGQGNRMTVLKFKISGYKDINEILAAVAKNGGHVVGVDYTEPFIEEFSIKR